MPNVAKGKKALLAKLYNKLFYLGKKRKPVIALEACTPFHFEHFKPVLSKLSQCNEIEVVIFTPEKQQANLNFQNVTYYPTLESYPLYKTIELFISTELNKIPYWLSCHSIFFGHGVGPKLNYVRNEGLLEYDFVFSPCKPIFDIQKSMLSAERVFPIGLPILDDKTFTSNNPEQNTQQNNIIKHFNLHPEKPILVYAPSWSNNIDKISDITKIIDFLTTKTQLNIIVSPHPLLFNPVRCAGKVFFSENKVANGVHLNKPDSKFSTLALVNASAIVISDISSILFEAMALRKNVLFDGNKALYEYSEALTIYEDIIKVCHTPNWNDTNDTTIESAITLDTLFNERQHFINNYLFNNGSAGDAFVKKLTEIIAHAKHI